MLRAALILAGFALAFGAPRSLFDIGDWPPHPGCHYNISQQANFQLPNGSIHWYFDSISGPVPLPHITCFDWRGNFTRLNGKNDGQLEYAQKIVQSNHNGTIMCQGPNFADANADFSTQCVFFVVHFGFQIRVADTDYKSYALITYCAGPDHNGNYVEFMGIIGPKKSGVDPAVRRRLVKRLVKAGWRADQVRRIPSQKDC